MRRLVFSALALAACTPSFEDTPWRIEQTRILGIAAQPAEARPGDVVSVSALVASPEGTVDVVPSWSVCTQPRTAAERSSVTQACLTGEALEPASPSLTVLADACARFGPNVPPAQGDEPARRPADPDASGGYRLPIQAALDDATAFGGVRIRCDLPGVTRAIFEAFEERYVANENPTIAAIRIDGIEIESTEATPIPPGEHEIEVELPAIAAEPYVRYRPEEGVLEDTREWLRVQWFVTGGALERGQILLEPSGDVTERVRVQWTRSDLGTDYGWVVVTDARGGATWQAFTVTSD